MTAQQIEGLKALCVKVDDDDVGLEADERERRLLIPGETENLEVGIGGERISNALAEERIVVHDNYAGFPMFHG